ncbi:MAG: oligosaccharide flippase family protein [Chloroflexi bacterium]|nr:oligosaccharide flippase family protein [Chloroflexota bacterium]
MTDPTDGEGLRGRIVGNTLAQFIAPGVRVVVGVVLVGLLGRYLGVAGFGEYGLVVAYVLLPTNLLAEWGLSTILVREIARRPEERSSLITSATLLQLVLAALSYAVLLGIALFSAYSVPVRVSLAVFGLTLFLAPVQMLTAHFAADLRLARLVVPAVAGTITQLVFVLVVVAAEGPLVAIVAAGLAGVAVEQGWTALLVGREISLARPTAGPWRLFLGDAWPLGISTLLTTAARQSPVLVLSAVSIEAVGMFAAAEKIPNYLTRVPYAFRATMLPVLSRRWLGPGGFRHLLWGAIGATFLLTAPVAIAGALLARDVVVLVFGAAFAGAALPFAILMIAFILGALGLLLEAVLVVIGAQRTNLAIRSVSAVVLVALVLALAGGSAATGSALAVLVAGATAALLSLLVIVPRVSAAR